MQASEAVYKQAANYAAPAANLAWSPGHGHDPMRANPDKFHQAWEEGYLAQYGGEPQRARYFYQQALEAAPEDIDTETLAGILEGLNCLQRVLISDEKLLPQLQTAVAEDPANSEKRFRYANLLWRLGREEEAGYEYAATLDYPETLCQECWRDCCNNLGWYLYRKAEFTKALPWFERAAKTKCFSRAPQGAESPVAFENIILVYVALLLRDEAEVAAIDYLSRFGRLPWPERRALQKIGIDADALFIERCGRI